LAHVLTDSEDRNCAFALKVFHNRDKTEAAFRREKDMIEKLAKYPHDHITPYLATWVQGGVPHILFPRAKYNLRTFMSTTDEPKLTPSFVLWFLKQFKGLAGAVAHFHWISDDRDETSASAGTAPDPGRLGEDLRQNQPKKMGLAGVHHDIKAENILVFEKETTESRHAGVFKISDFGAGRFANLAVGEISTPVKAAKGTMTYKAPEKNPSRPFDLWALGCVFLELLLWALTPIQDGGKGFSDERGWMSNRKPGPAEPSHPDDAFWLLNSDTGKPELRWAVNRQIQDLLEVHCKGKKAFQRVTRITKDLFTINPLKRPAAKQVFDDLEDIYREAELELDLDPHCYISHHARNTSDSLSAADAYKTNTVTSAVEPERYRDRSPKRPADDDIEYESDEAPFQFLKRRRKSSAERVPAPSDAILNIYEPSQSAAPQAQGAESEDDLSHVGPENLRDRSRSLLIDSSVSLQTPRTATARTAATLANDDTDLKYTGLSYISKEHDVTQSEQYPQPMNLLTQYENTRDEFEKAHDLVLSSALPKSEKEEADLWLDNIVSSLLTWAVDIRIQEGSLEMIAHNSESMTAMIIESAFTELRSHLQTFLEQLRSYMR
jgi:serine/threonine protein kinase